MQFCGCLRCFLFQGLTFESPIVQARMIVIPTAETAMTISVKLSISLILIRSCEACPAAIESLFRHAGSSDLEGQGGPYRFIVEIGLVYSMHMNHLHIPFAYSLKLETRDAAYIRPCTELLNLADPLFPTCDHELINQRFPVERALHE